MIYSNRRFHFLIIICLLLLSIACTVKPTSNIKSEYSKYSKQVKKIVMRDSVQLNTEIFIPLNAKVKLPILLTRTPYGLRHNTNGLHSALNSSYKELADDQYIFIFQDIRGRFNSGGEFSMLRTPVSEDANANVD